MPMTLPPPPVLSTFHLDCMGAKQITGVGTGSLMSAASAVFPLANSAVLHPFKLCDWATAYQLLLHIGATTSGNVDIGIYDSQGNRIVSSGSTAAGIINTLQQFNIADTVLSPGDYFLAVGCDNITCTMFRDSSNDEFLLPRSALYQITGLTGPTLPATITPAIFTLTATTYLIVAGIQFRSVL